ncbi:MAG TPA: hypothetical protein DCQ32_00265 [Cyanobacteria bacterium UBA8156]|jgi:hypothetical protein|nr:hypothetical protein [Cyanobacteria bacterium UBA8156]
MQFIKAKQAYPLLAGVGLALVGVWLWQQVWPPVREVVEPPPVVIPPLPRELAVPPPNPQGQAGTLRVGNRTDRPVRVIVWHRPQSKPGWEANEPMHWDFAPGEGGTGGLILSLPDRQVAVQPGDVVFAFATDGSRVYWGPNVVGETSAPFWDKDRQEWSAILQP